MSLFDYNVGLEIARKDYPFYALLQALMRKADSHNIEILKQGWPDEWNDLRRRYDAPGGILPEEQCEEGE